MIDELHQKYIDTKFPPELVQMFADIIEADEVAKKVCIFIGRTERGQRGEDLNLRGVTINDIVENVMVDRLTKVEKGRSYTFHEIKTNIHRKTAERQVDKLLDMSLLFYKHVKPYKFLFLTIRGWQIVEEIVKNRAIRINQNKQ
ncbi:hypothetical protein HPT25_26180 [Bacillus sp. BRMEA1]|uniref:hypothetical protein n=1 Tax=Neobacillus endophyticus TaxID=2738405 RepID=UPI001564B5AB|nr:hypothetical protein [Neobacillus endophyticus]NRD80819.1 hypothetical protein [Neobacillus endophyticus]